ncbi:MAG: hypothetical protein FWF25_05235 [Propionibacteriaceae bacterium]|nr:hypothetical protein [Propionibacteriaceae bacterium]
MDVSGLIFAVLAVACLLYFVPRQISWRIPTQEQVEQQAPSRRSVKTVHTGIPVDQEQDKPVEVSTVLMRRAGRRVAMRLAKRAAKRRQGVFVALILVTLATVPFAVLRMMMQWWVPLVGAAVVAAWAVFSRIEARRERKQLDAIVADTELGDNEKTLSVQVEQKTEPRVDDALVGPNGDVQLSLWEPITVVPATYISAPTAARTVRTIDLAASATGLPITDDWRQDGQAIAV